MNNLSTTQTLLFNRAQAYAVCSFIQRVLKICNNDLDSAASILANYGITLEK